MSRWQQQFCNVRQTWKPSQGWGDLVPCVPLWALQGWWEPELPLQRDVVSPCAFIALFFLLHATLLHCTGPGRFLGPAQPPRYLVFASFAFHNLEIFFITGVDFNLNY